MHPKERIIVTLDMQEHPECTVERDRETAGVWNLQEGVRLPGRLARELAAVVHADVDLGDPPVMLFGIFGPAGEVDVIARRVTGPPMPAAQANALYAKAADAMGLDGRAREMQARADEGAEVLQPALDSYLYGDDLTRMRVVLQSALDASGVVTGGG